MSVKDYGKDCTDSCCSQQHGDYLNAAVTLREPTDRELASFLSMVCGNIGGVTDSLGRTVLHMAASVGRRELVQWLVQKCGANLNAQDKESGYTTLHRSIFYGQLNVTFVLLQMGADLNIHDHNFLSAIELATNDRPPEVKFSTNLPCELYVWGSNTNYNLGIDNIQGRLQPELLDYFRKQSRLTSIVQVCMEKFHTVLVSACGKVWTCGHGQGGRLGLGSERTYLSPVQVQLGSVTKSPSQNSKSVPGQHEVCKACAAGRDHTILLMESYTILVFGLNTHHVLGLSPAPAKVLEPHHLPLKYLDDLKFPPVGVCAGRFHSVIWSRGEILTFGLNAGQLGHPKSIEKTIIVPKPVNAMFFRDTDITHVAASDGATVVATGNRHIWVLHEYQKSKLSMRYPIEIEQVVVVGGHLDSELDHNSLSEKGETLKVAAISKEGSVYLWQEKDFQMTRCILSLKRQLKIVDIHLNLGKSAMLLVTDDGEAFSGEIRPPKQNAVDNKSTKGRRIPYTQPNYDGECHVLYKQADKNHIKVFLDPDVCYTIHLERLPNAHRAVKVVSDPKGRNFGLIQTHPSSFLKNVPELPIERQVLKKDLCNLLNEACEWDRLHDIVFQVDHKHFYAHQFIVFTHSKILFRMFQDSKKSCMKGNVPVVQITDVTGDLFKNFLQFMYTGDCSLLHAGPAAAFLESSKEPDDLVSQRSMDPTQKHDDSSNPLLQARKAAKKLGLIKLVDVLSHAQYQDGRMLWAHSTSKNIKVPILEPIELEWNTLSEFSDINVISKDGTSFGVHKCMLAARSEYFHNMLTGGWIESQGTRNLPLPFNQSTLSVLFDYIYKDETPSLNKIENVNFELAMNALIAADLLLIKPLKVRCEAALASLLTLRNAKIVLDLATTYNAPGLQNCCYQFISLNLSVFLETGMLYGLSPSVLDGLQEYYCRMHPRMDCRIITPFSSGPSIDFVKELAVGNPVVWVEEISFENSDEIEYTKKMRHSSKKKRVRRTSEGHKLRNCADPSGSINSDDLDTSLEPLDWSEIVEKDKLNLNDSIKKISLAEGFNSQEKAEKQTDWMKVISSSKINKSIQARLKAAAVVQEEVMGQDSSLKQQPVFTTLSVKPHLPSLESPREANKVVHFEAMEKDFPTLGGTDDFRASPKTSFISMSSMIEKRPSKLSQKQRKMMAESISSPPVPIPVRGWDIREELLCTPPSHSLADIMHEELEKSKQSFVVPQPSYSKRSPSNANQTPWGKVHNTMNSSIPLRTIHHSPDKSDPAVKFSDIVADEMKQRENWTRMRAKPLNLTQIEDRAIDDLINFYNASEACEERITVRRVLSTKVACPVWVTSKNRDSLS